VRLPVVQPAMKAHLDALIARTDRVARRDDDPVSFVHLHADPHDREVVALLAALLAFGNVKTIRASVARALAALGPSPARTIDTSSEAEIAARLEGFVHRVYRGSDVARVLAGAAALRARHGSLARAIDVLSRAEPGAEEASSRARLVRSLAAVGDALRGPAPHRRGLVHLVPDRAAGQRGASGCSSSMRWMCRPADGVDLGLFALPRLRAAHPARHARAPHRAQPAASPHRPTPRSARPIEVTARARALDADGSRPLRLRDLPHRGSRARARADATRTRCAACEIRSVCRHWALRRPHSRRGSRRP
jgi:GNAT superfamily N-acetyltransferase